MTAERPRPAPSSHADAATPHSNEPRNPLAKLLELAHIMLRRPRTASLAAERLAADPSRSRRGTLEDAPGRGGLPHPDETWGPAETAPANDFWGPSEASHASPIKRQPGATQKAAGLVAAANSLAANSPPPPTAPAAAKPAAAKPPAAKPAERTLPERKPSERETIDAETLERVLTASSILFTERGFAAATLEKVASETGVRAGLLQYQFGSKEVLNERVRERALQRYVTAITPPLAAREGEAGLASEAGLLQLFQSFAREESHQRLSLWTLLEGDAEATPKEQALMNELVAPLTNAKRRGLVSSDLDPELLLIAVQGLLQGWHHHRSRFASRLGHLGDASAQQQAYVRLCQRLLETVGGGATAKDRAASEAAAHLAKDGSTLESTPTAAGPAGLPLATCVTPTMPAPVAATVPRLATVLRSAPMAAPPLAAAMPPAGAGDATAAPGALGSRTPHSPATEAARPAARESAERGDQSSEAASAQGSADDGSDAGVDGAASTATDRKSPDGKHSKRRRRKRR